MLFSERQIQSRVSELGAAITKDYQGLNLLLIGVLKGSFIFLADLCRTIEVPLQTDFIGLASYGDRTTPGVVRITADLTHPIEGMDVLVVEDIVDTGASMRHLVESLPRRHPRSVKICTLLDKPSRRAVTIALDYVGFVVPDVFVVGYGLDYQGRYRNLRHIAAINNQEGERHA